MKIGRGKCDLSYFICGRQSIYKRKTDGMFLYARSLVARALVKNWVLLQEPGAVAGTW
jgi:hypothetical protein